MDTRTAVTSGASSRWIARIAARLACTLSLVHTPLHALAHHHDDDGPASRPAQVGVAPSDDPRSRFLTSRSSAAQLALPHEDDSFLFAIYGDRTGGPADGVKVLAHAVEETNLVDPDLVMTVGDLVQGYNDTPLWLEQMREFKSIMDRLACPWFPVVGNHDVYWRGEGTAPKGGHEADFERHFGPLWYAFEHKRCWFVCLYSDEDDPQKGDKTFDDPRGQRVSPEQFAWLDRTLERARDARHVFVFLHHPRWLGGHYGDDWNRVHERLVAAGNVHAVFAGHIHRMRYDGKRDGIEYFALATVGGVQDGFAPAAGYLHEYHLVTVREHGIEVVMLPVGSAMDPRAITGAISDDVRKLAQALPQRVLGRADFLHDVRHGAPTLSLELSNPTSRTVEFTLTPRSDDSRWRFDTDHAHASLAAGTHQRLELHAYHEHSGALDDSIRAPELVLDVDYLGEGLRVPLPQRVLAIEVDTKFMPRAQQTTHGVERVLVLDGNAACARIADDSLALPDGPFTVEGWLAPRRFSDRAGFVCKTESSEFGLFVSDGKPEFSVHLAGKYVTARAPDVALRTDEWQHVAGVYDGAEVRVYANGRVLARTAGSGARTHNELPLYIGADVTKTGAPDSFLDARVDAVRISSSARYTSDAFTPQRSLPVDDTTILALDMEEKLGPWLLDTSTHHAAAQQLGSAHTE